MVVEQIFRFEEIQRKPYLVSAAAFIFTGISVILATMIPNPTMGFFIIALTVMPAIPFFIRATVCEEKGEEIFTKLASAIPAKKFERGRKSKLVSMYNTTVQLYMYFFFGCVIGFAFTSSIMPESSSQLVFSDVRQLMLSVMSTSSQALNTLNTTSFWEIFSHNLKLMLVMVLFSFVYSIGAVFLLVLNAAVIGLFFEQGIRNMLPGFSSLGLLAYPTAFIAGSFVGILQLLPHGICEFSAFFMASVAGGIISVAMERKAYKKRATFKVILADVAKLLILAVLLLALGAFIESSYSMLPSFLK
ncbi:stage II sporulation protein M [Candidatus Micrarchaeota archaeon]|nr:stage II sporulation protein M [Candidatus Micrarchaeota archaeon]